MLAWVVVILAFVAFKEYTLRTGDDVLLRTVPVDPVDMFRGDYVVLRYDISTIDITKLGQIGGVFIIGDTVYVSLRLDEQGVASATLVSKDRPREGLFIRGKVEDVRTETLRVSYGIESYFVPQGTGRQIERQGDMLVRITVDEFGNAVIRNVVIDGKTVRLEDLKRPELP